MSDDQDHIQCLPDELSRLKDRYENLLSRLKAYYDGDETVFKEPPDENLQIKAGNIIIEGIDYYQNQPTRFETGTGLLQQTWHVFIAIGTEMLLNAITLRNDPDWYFNKTSEDDASPPFEKCKNRLMSLLPEVLDGSQRTRIYTVLELIQVQRNHLVHLNLSVELVETQTGPIHQVLHFLFEQFSIGDQDVVGRLEEAHKQYRETYDPLPYEPIEFP